MREFLFTLLQAVATAAIPVCAAFLVQFLRKKSEQIGAQIDNMELKELLDEVTDAVSTAVTYTSQTYVDALKKEGIFDVEAQKTALETSLKMAISLLSESARSALATIYETSTTTLSARSRQKSAIRRQLHKSIEPSPVITPGRALFLFLEAEQRHR